MATLFISDLHLCPSRPQIGRLFFDFLSGPAREADALYILGDLFEHWAGDDDLDDPSNAEVCVALQALSASGVALFFMAGNRDFLCGETFAKAAGLKLLPDPALIEIAGTATLLMHGDTLCTDDDAYQAFRAEVRSPEWRQAFLTLPLDRRKARIEALRRESEAQKRVKPTDIMDANPGAVLQTLTFTAAHASSTAIPIVRPATCWTSQAARRNAGCCRIGMKPAATSPAMRPAADC